MRLRSCTGGAFFKGVCAAMFDWRLYGPAIVCLLTMGVVTTMFVSSLVQ